MEVGGDLAPGPSTAPPTTCSYQPSTGQGSNALSCRGRKVSSSWSIAWSHNHKCHLDVTLRCFQIFLGINDTFTCLNCRGLNKQARYIMVVWKLNCTRLKLNFVSGMPRADLLQRAAEECGDVCASWSSRTHHTSLHQPSVTQQRPAPGSFSTLRTRGASELWNRGASYLLLFSQRCLTSCGGWRDTSSPDLAL